MIRRQNTRLLSGFTRALALVLGGGLLASTTVADHRMENHMTDAPAIRIGVPIANSGPLANFATQQLKGMELYIDDINTRGALLGRPVELVTVNAGSTAAGAQQAIAELLDSGVRLLVSPYSSEQTLAVKPQVLAADVAMLSIATAPQIWQDNTTHHSQPKIFGLYTPANENMLPLLQLAQEKGLTRIAVLHQQSEFPEAVAQSVRQHALQMGLQLVFDQSYSATTQDFSALTAQLAASQPQVVIVGSYLKDAVDFAIRAQGLNPKLIAFSGAPALRDFGDQIGHSKAQGVISTVQWMRDVRFPGSFDFGFRYRERHGTYPSYDAAGGYAALQVIEAAVRLAGSAEPSPVRATLAKMKFRSIVGHYRVDKQGRQTAKKTYLVQWQDSHISLVYPPEIARFKLLYPFPGW